MVGGEKIPPNFDVLRVPDYTGVEQTSEPPEHRSLDQNLVALF